MITGCNRKCLGVFGADLSKAGINVFEVAVLIYNVIRYAVRFLPLLLDLLGLL